VQNSVFSRRKPILGFSPEKSFLEKRSLSSKSFSFSFSRFSQFSRRKVFSFLLHHGNGATSKTFSMKIE
jgi:hypothetical protein